MVVEVTGKTQFINKVETNSPGCVAMVAVDTTLLYITSLFIFLQPWGHIKLPAAFTRQQEPTQENGSTSTTGAPR